MDYVSNLKLFNEIHVLKFKRSLKIYLNKNVLHIAIVNGYANIVNLLLNHSTIDVNTKLISHFNSNLILRLFYI